LICHSKPESNFSPKDKNTAEGDEKGEGLTEGFTERRIGGAFEIFKDQDPDLPRPPHRADLPAICQLQRTPFITDNSN
jgi:hypothetical protein